MAFNKAKKMQKLPCPFCGGSDSEVIEEASDSDEAYMGYGLAVYCECGAQGRVGHTEEEAIALWNKRLTGVQRNLPMASIPLEIAAKTIIERLEYLAENGSFSPTDDWVLKYLRLALELFERLQTNNF